MSWGFLTTIALGHSLTCLSVLMLHFHFSMGTLISVMIIPDGLIIGIQAMSFRRGLHPKIRILSAHTASKICFSPQ